MKAAHRLREFHYARRGWFLAAALAAVAAARAFSDAPLRPAWLWLWAAGLAWRAWAGFHIGGHSNGRAWTGTAPAYSGPYRLSRHPLYFANLLSSAGLLLYANCLPAGPAAALFFLIFAHHDLLARAEESHLIAAQGEGYLGYMRVTSRWPWFPSGALARGRGGAAATSAAGDGPARWREAWARQGANLVKGCAGAAIIRIAEAVSR